MIKVISKLPAEVTVAFSGGVDSVAVVDFLSKTRTVTCAFYHHGTTSSEEAYQFVKEFCRQRSLELIVGKYQGEQPTSNKETFWRDCRYAFLESLPGVVITGHNLDDCVETYIWSALHGNPKVIPFKRNNVIRPFLTTRKTEFIDWCTRKNINWCEDSSNTDTAYTRNLIRHELMPAALKVNPGLPTTVRKIIEKQLKEL